MADWTPVDDRLLVVDGLDEIRRERLLFGTPRRSPGSKEI